MRAIRVAADVGGTFTDVVGVDATGAYVALKVTSVPGAYERGIGEGASRAVAALSGDSISELLHATTVATNAVLERTGPRTGLVTSRGFRDVLEIGRLRIPNSYDLNWSKPRPIVARRDRLEVDERTTAEGEILVRPDLETLAATVDAAVSEGVRAFAIALLNSYANPDNELAVAAWLAKRHPSVPVTASTEIVREAGEFERTSTAVVDAYLKPVLGGYLDRLAAELEGRRLPAPIVVMQSSGGMLPATEARDQPVRVLESGPAAGALAAAGIARRSGLAAVVSFDMGGTTAKACLVDAGEVGYGAEFTVGSEISAMSRLLRGGGYTVRLPAIDLAEVGAGGGSLARVDAAGGLQVGPQSAGADPGPACYGRGGTLATVTDANLLLGHLSVAGLRRGGVEVRRELAEAALERAVAGPLGLSIEDAAEAVHRVADQQMARALRAVTTERGRDLGVHTLVAFGGSGPVHAASLAEAVGIRAVVIPVLAGVLSAVGLLASAVELGAVEPIGRPLLAEQMPALEARLEDMEARLRQRLPGSAVRRTLDMAFRGQGYDLAIAASAPLPAAGVLAADFRARHLALYGHAASAPIEVVRARVVAAVPAGANRLAPAHGDGLVGELSRPGRFGGAAAPVSVVRRSDLDGRLPGPLYVDDLDTTTVVPPGWTVELDAYGSLVLSR